MLNECAIPDNVDYNDLKHLIKVHTSKDHSRAFPIPIHESDAQRVQQFEQELKAELERQHERVNEFVQVKAGELSRKLGG